ncbi:MAG: glycosidase, partial [Acidimicrobiia bacterium]
MIEVKRIDLQIRPDPARILARPFLPAEPVFGGGPTRVELIAHRVLALDDNEAKRLLAQTRLDFADRHRDLHSVWLENANRVEDLIPSLPDVDGDRRELLGAFFTQEYAPETAALCNPSIVPLAGGAPGTFVMSLRAIGEGHISSVEFRTGSVNDDGQPTIDEPGSYLTTGRHRSAAYDRSVFRRKLLELGADDGLVDSLMAGLPESFGATELNGALEVLGASDVSPAAAFETRRLTNWLASSNYELVYDMDIPIGERILLPSSPAESRGIEDARFVHFVEDDGTSTYYATYTAYDGFSILPQLIETTDFLTFRFATLNGTSARNKGMALFPRRIGGLYAALGRHDQENLHLLRTDDLRTWDFAELISSPEHGWETVQIGA